MTFFLFFFFSLLYVYNVFRFVYLFWCFGQFVLDGDRCVFVYFYVQSIKFAELHSNEALQSFLRSIGQKGENTGAMGNTNGGYHLRLWFQDINVYHLLFCYHWFSKKKKGMGKNRHFKASGFLTILLHHILLLPIVSF